ncbi:hypothetical protein BDN72DRAFT_801944 [Pluteus cervinus]|uniref:Uncharacterized protein n=1 Tax=Pluteus cervinus TaxID=181527 RepID=A0ACD3AFE5_9AGAR|nr:hypothetical protein BDN72DRAFT_801944 [Pluteus cervinus]
MIAVIPPELIHSILLFASAKEPGVIDPDYNTLCQLALVHPTWTEPAQSLLYYHITYRKSIAFVDHALSIAVEKRKLHHTKILDIGISPLGAVPNSHHDADETRLVNILTVCPNIVDLAIRPHGLYAIDPSTVTKFVDLVNTRTLSIRTLRLLDYPVQSPVVLNLAILFPTMASLVLGSESYISPPDTSFDLRLEEFILYRTVRADTLSWFLASSKTSLRVLELRDPVSSGMAALLANHGPSIQTLRIMNYNSAAAGIVEICTNLKELVLLNVPTLVPMPKLPHTLQHLAFMNQAYVSSSTLLPVVKAIQTAPSLLTLRCPQETQKHSEFPLLAQACDSHKINLIASLPKSWMAVQ